jgi:hypothetical protein
MADLLGSEGLRRDRRTWRRTVGEVVQVTDVQASIHNYTDVARFTINLGVWHPTADKLLDRPVNPAERGPSVLECTMDVRIGQLAEDHVDTWWDALSELPVGAQVAAVVRDHGLGWLDLCSDPAQAIDWIEAAGYGVRDGPFVVLALAQSLGPEHARAALRRWDEGRWELQDENTAEYAGEIRRWAAERGIGS